MELEQRVQALEQEVRLLKNQIQAMLLDIQEQLLTNTYPSLMADNPSPSKGDDRQSEILICPSEDPLNTGNFQHGYDDHCGHVQHV